MKQVSFLDYPDLIGTARFGVRLTPSELAERFSLLVERSFDDLGSFDFVGVSTPDAVFGFRHHPATERPYSYVSCKPFGGHDARTLISELCEVSPAQIDEFDENW